MPVVDADAHIDETDETWEYMDEEFVKYKPITVTQTFGEAPPILPWGYNRYWFVDGKIRVAAIGMMCVPPPQQKLVSCWTSKRGSLSWMNWVLMSR